MCNGKNGRLNAKVDDTTAHRDHIHLELNKRAAKLGTSWWTAGPGAKIVGRTPAPKKTTTASPSPSASTGTPGSGGTTNPGITPAPIANAGNGGVSLR